MTGHPDYDRYHEIDGAKVREETRQKLGVDKNQFLIVYSGLLPPETTETLDHLTKELNKVDSEKEIVLLLSKHPRDTFPEEDYKRILGQFKGKVLMQGKFTSDQICYACDLLIAPGPSTEGLKAGYRGIPSLHIMTHDLYGDYPNEKIPLPVQAGASGFVEDFPQLYLELEKAVKFEDFRNKLVENARREFSTDGKAVERVAEVIKKAANH